MAEIIDFAERRAAKLRKEDTHLARIFKNLEAGQDMQGVSTEQLLRWADRLNRAKDSDTIEEICRDVEAIIGQKTIA